MEMDMKKYINRLNTAKNFALFLTIPMINLFVNIFGIISVIWIILLVILLRGLKFMPAENKKNMKYGLIVVVACAVSITVIHATAFSINVHADNWYWKYITDSSMFRYIICLFIITAIAIIILQKQYNYAVNCVYNMIIENELLDKSTDSDECAKLVNSTRLKTVRVIYAISICLNTLVLGLALGIEIIPSAYLGVLYIFVHIWLSIAMLMDKYLPRKNLLFLIGVICYLNFELGWRDGYTDIGFFHISSGSDNIMYLCLLFYSIFQIIYLVFFNKIYIQKYLTDQKKQYIEKHFHQKETV